MGREENIFKGALFIFFSAVCYTVMGILVKASNGIVENSQLVFVRNFVSLCVLLPFLFYPKKVPLSTKVLGTHLIRGITGLLNMYSFFYSLHFILLSDAMLLNNTMPLFIPLILWIWKGRKISLSLALGMVVGFLGVAFILQPNRSLFHPAAFFALASGLLMAISMTGVRTLSKTEPILRILFYYFIIATTLSFFPLLKTGLPLTIHAWILLLGVGISAMVYQVFLTMGYQQAPASKVSPFIYFAVVLSAIYDWIFSKETPDLYSLLGIVLVIAAAIFCTRKEAPAAKR